MLLKSETKFKRPKDEVPKVPTGESIVKVYFIVDNVLYKGTYHRNGHFYAYKITGNFDMFASADGIVKSWGADSKNSICQGWCYVDDFKLTE